VEFTPNFGRGESPYVSSPCSDFGVVGFVYAHRGRVIVDGADDFEASVLQSGGESAAARVQIDSDELRFVRWISIGSAAAHIVSSLAP
jgi:hypothetical protein